MSASDSLKFITSCAKADKYPLNLSLHGSSNGGLKAHRALLVENAPHLFHKKSAVVVLEFRGIENPKDSVTPRILKDDADFTAWLTAPKADGSSPTSDIRCRHIFFQAASSQAKLDVSLAHARKILTYFQVMPSYIDFMSVFTVKTDDEQEIGDLRFSSFREQLRLSDPVLGLRLNHLALGGRGYQLTYNLKCVANKSRESGLWPAVAKEKWSWSTRQAAFHHQFDVDRGTTLWILTAARDELQKRVQELTGQTGKKAQASTTRQTGQSADEDELETRRTDRTFTTVEESFIASLSVHLLLAQWASEDWRGYIRWLEQMLEKKTKPALTAETYEPTTFDLLFVQTKEDITNKAVMTLDSNAKILESLDSFYINLMKNGDFHLRNSDACKRAAADFSMQLQDFIYDTKMYSDRAKTLSKITADRKNLVQQHLQAKATDRVEKLTIQQQEEAKIMRIIAVLTLIYLPATFVSTFFSTDVIKYQNQGNSGDNSTDTSSSGRSSYSGLALERWFEVTAPLTVVTFALAVGWYYYWASTKKHILAWWRGESNKDSEKGYKIEQGTKTTRNIGGSNWSTYS